MKCNICPRQCNIDRESTLGFCKATNEFKIAKYMVHFWEEPVISGTNGSGAIFFSHCNLKCVYCQNYQISWLGQGINTTIENFINIVKELESKKVHNINLVTPSHYTDLIIKAFRIYKPSVPIVWNSNGYESVETLQKLKNVVDIYLVDMKYADNNLASLLSGAKDYPEVCKKAIIEMRKNQPNDIFSNGIMEKGLIVRHLVIPNEIKNTFDVLDWISNTLGNQTYLSLMGQYTPYHLVTTLPTLSKYNCSLKPIEYKRAINHLNNLGIVNGFYQDLSSSNQKFIPDFDKFSD